MPAKSHDYPFPRYSFWLAFEDSTEASTAVWVDFFIGIFWRKGGRWRLVDFYRRRFSLAPFSRSLPVKKEDLNETRNVNNSYGILNISGPSKTQELDNLFESAAYLLRAFSLSIHDAGWKFAFFYLDRNCVKCVGLKLDVPVWQ